MMFTTMPSYMCYIPVPYIYMIYLIKSQLFSLSQGMTLISLTLLR